MTEEIIDQIRSRAERDHLPVMRRETSKLLARTTEALRPTCALEIGTCLGVSALTVLSHSTAKLTTVDVDADVQEAARRYIDRCGYLDRTTFVTDDCFAALAYLSDERYDLIVLDGPKGHYDELYRLLIPMLNPGGVLFCDDVDFHGLTEGKGYPDHKHRTIVYGMRRFLDLVAADTDVTTERFDVEDGVLIVKKQDKKNVGR